jgi:hypothetical protein
MLVPIFVGLTLGGVFGIVSPRLGWAAVLLALGWAIVRSHGVMS